FFPIAYFVSTARDISPLSLMIAVSIASTCAFMTPVATPCNALAFGEMKGTSFRMMLILGFFLNIIGAFLMAVWVQFVVSLIYQ
ncbi:MAG: sodium:sulfate symporter, partial [Deltaproteobacteria bacterium]